MSGYYRKYLTEESINVIEYHYCDLGTSQIGCRPGSQKI